MLRIGRYLVSTGVNGPGKRFVIWLQGCPIRCKGCYNPEFWQADGGMQMRVEEVMALISSCEGIEGVTFTGGEPLAQAQELVSLAKLIKQQGLSIVCYTGYLYEDIVNGKIPHAKELLDYLDILIDGPYVEEAKAPLLWRGSRNQRVYFLTERYKHLEPLALKEGTREIEIKIVGDEVVMTGILDMELWRRLKRKI